MPDNKVYEIERQHDRNKGYVWLVGRNSWKPTADTTLEVGDKVVFCYRCDYVFRCSDGSAMLCESCSAQGWRYVVGTQVRLVLTVSCPEREATELVEDLLNEHPLCEVKEIHTHEYKACAGGEEHDGE